MQNHLKRNGKISLYIGVIYWAIGETVQSKHDVLKDTATQSIVSNLINLKSFQGLVIDPSRFGPSIHILALIPSLVTLAVFCVCSIQILVSFLDLLILLYVSGT